MSERDAATSAETRSRTPKVTRGTGGGTDSARQTDTAHGDRGGDEALTLIEQVVRRETLVAAHARVVRNGGAPGVDGMTVADLMPSCRQHWARIREQLLSGTYAPQPVRRVEIPKPAGKGVRMLGIPTVPTDSFNRPCSKSSPPSLTPPSRMRALAFVRDGARTRRSSVPVVIPRRDIAGWWTWTSRNSSTGSTTTY